MVLEEKIKKALSEDVQMMIEVGNFYSNILDEVEDKVSCLELAQNFFEKAARLGNVRAMALLCAVAAYQAYLEREVMGIDSGDTMSKYRYLYEWRMMEMYAYNNYGPDYESVDVDVLKKELKDNGYDYALTCYFCGDIKEAYSVANSIDDPRTKILESYIEYHDVLDECKDIVVNKLSKLQVTIDKLIVAITDENYLNSEKGRWEERLLAAAYVEGGVAARTILENIDLSVGLLQMGKVYIKDDEAAKMIEDELRHYEKNIFGKYEYKK